MYPKINVSFEPTTRPTSMYIYFLNKLMAIKNKHFYRFKITIFLNMYLKILYYKILLYLLIFINNF